MNNCPRCSILPLGSFCNFCNSSPFGGLGGLGQGMLGGLGQFVNQHPLQDYYEWMKRQQEIHSKTEPFVYKGDFIEGDFEVISEPKQLENK